MIHIKKKERIKFSIWYSTSRSNLSRFYLFPKLGIIHKRFDEGGKYIFIFYSISIFFLFKFFSLFHHYYFITFTFHYNNSFLTRSLLTISQFCYFYKYYILTWLKKKKLLLFIGFWRFKYRSPTFILLLYLLLICWLNFLTTGY